jgi:hypothetical protein
MTEVIVPLTQVEVRPEDMEDLGWQDRALCAQTDPEAFFPESTRLRTTSGLVSGAGCPSGNGAGSNGKPFSCTGSGMWP